MYISLSKGSSRSRLMPSRYRICFGPDNVKIFVFDEGACEVLSAALDGFRRIGGPYLEPPSLASDCSGVSLDDIRGILSGAWE
jgi:hypothetical protein